MVNKKEERDLSNYNSLHTIYHDFIRLKYGDRPIQLRLEKRTFMLCNCVIHQDKTHQTKSLRCRVNLSNWESKPTYCQLIVPNSDGIWFACSNHYFKNFKMCSRNSSSSNNSRELFHTIAELLSSFPFASHMLMNTTNSNFI